MDGGKNFMGWQKKKKNRNTIYDRKREILFPVYDVWEGVGMAETVKILRKSSGDAAGNGKADGDGGWNAEEFGESLYGGRGNQCLLDDWTKAVVPLQ